MTEIQARYTVGNIVYTDLSRGPAGIRPQSMNPVPAEHDTPRPATGSAYLRAVDTSEQSNQEFQSIPGYVMRGVHITEYGDHIIGNDRSNES